MIVQSIKILIVTMEEKRSDKDGVGGRETDQFFIDLTGIHPSLELL